MTYFSESRIFHFFPYTFAHPLHWVDSSINTFAFHVSAGMTIIIGLFEDCNNSRESIPYTEKPTFASSIIVSVFEPLRVKSPIRTNHEKYGISRDSF
jgi:hypothetical protein